MDAWNAACEAVGLLFSRELQNATRRMEDRWTPSSRSPNCVLVFVCERDMNTHGFTMVVNIQDVVSGDAFQVGSSNPSSVSWPKLSQDAGVLDDIARQISVIQRVRPDIKHNVSFLIEKKGD